MNEVSVNGHLTDEELVLHHYGDLVGEAGTHVRGHLGACADCRATLAEIRSVLARLDDAVVPEPDPGFEAAMWARIRPRLDGRGGQRRTPAAWLALAAAAALVTATAAGLWVVQSARGEHATRAGAAIPDPALKERVLLTALDDHLAQTQLLLVEVLNAPEVEGLSFAFERRVADDLVASGRLYRTTAEQSGNTNVVEILDELEPVFIEIARSADTLERDELRSLRARIDDSDLLFKVRAATNELIGRDPVSDTNEGTL